MTKKIVYIGGDATFVTELEKRVEPDRLTVSVAGSGGLMQPIWTKLVVFILDCDEVADPFGMLDRLRELNPCSATILISPLCELPLTRLSLARLHGAESFHWKPITDWGCLLASLRGAFERLVAWQDLLLRFENEHPASPKVLFSTLPPTAVNFPAPVPLNINNEVCLTEVLHQRPGMAVPVL